MRVCTRTRRPHLPNPPSYNTIGGRAIHPMIRYLSESDNADLRIILPELDDRSSCKSDSPCHTNTTSLEDSRHALELHVRLVETLTRCRDCISIAYMRHRRVILTPPLHE